MAISQYENFFLARVSHISILNDFVYSCSTSAIAFQMLINAHDCVIYKWVYLPTHNTYVNTYCICAQLELVFNNSSTYIHTYEYTCMWYV